MERERDQGGSHPGGRKVGGVSPPRKGQEEVCEKKSSRHSLPLQFNFLFPCPTILESAPTSTSLSASSPFSLRLLD